MLDVITKTGYFAALDDPQVAQFLKTAPHDLKRVQDAYIYSLLKGSKGLRIAEAGGGDSRLMRALDRSNELWNVDEFRGRDGGPPAVIEIPGCRTVISRLGDFSQELPANHFDVVFSISVIEHLPNAKAITDFFRDGARILRPGGVMHHAIDIYLKDGPFDYSGERVRLYRELAQQDGLQFVQPPAVGADLHFHCDYATNPDLGMYGWNKAVPSLTELRLHAQSVSLKMALRKAG